MADRLRASIQVDQRGLAWGGRLSRTSRPELARQCPCNASHGGADFPLAPSWFAVIARCDSTIIMESRTPVRVEQLIHDCPVSVTPDQCGFQK